MRRVLRCVLLLLVTALVLAGTGVSTAAERPVVAVIGDSFTAGWTGTTTSQADAWWNYTAADLGWTVGNIVANPGAGYVKPGMYGTIGQALAAHPIPATTDFVLLQAGLNDDASNPEAVVAAIAGVMALVHEQAPNATPIVLGMLIPTGQSMSVNRLAVARAMGDGRAIGGARYTIGSMATFQTCSDGTHPTAAGHAQLGHWVTWHLKYGLDNGQPLVLDPTGTFYTTS